MSLLQQRKHVPAILRLMVAAAVLLGAAAALSAQQASQMTVHWDKSLRPQNRRRRCKWSSTRRCVRASRWALLPIKL